MKTTEEMIAVMSAFKEGKEIEYFDDAFKEWASTDNPIWSWDCCDYRVKDNTLVKFHSIEEFYIKTIEIGGFVGTLKALRLPFGKDCRTNCCFNCDNVRNPKDDELSFFYNGDIVMNADFAKDLELMSTLVKRGDEHGKVMRGIMVWAEINAPRYLHAEIDTYRIGAERLSSESTMHIQGKGMPTEELVAMKENLPEGTMQKRVWMLSYQALRRIYKQRHDHRLPQWHMFCDWIKTLPFAKELILVGLE